MISSKKSHRFLLTYHDDQLTHFPHYHHYAYILHKIKTFLQEEFSLSFQIYDFEDDQELWAVIEEDMSSGSKELQILGHVYDYVEIGQIKYNSSQKQAFEVKPSISNTLIYYPRFTVCVVKIPIFQAHDDYYREFLFAADPQKLQQFFQYIVEREREIVKNHIMIYIDTEDGVELKRERIEQSISRDDVILNPEIKKEIFRSIDQFFLNDGAFFKSNHLPYKRGILLYGKPGNGKTTLVKSIARSISAPVIYWQVTEYTNSSTIQEIFDKACHFAPVVLVIEDLDSIPEGVRSFFLNTLDGASSKEGIFLIGTTNYPEKIDPALINRAGRFDRAYEIHPPNAEMRREYLTKRNIKQFLTDEQVEEVVIQTEGFSFAQLNELFTSVAIEFHYDNQVNLSRLLSLLKRDLRKGETGEWLKDNKQIGF